MKTLLITTLTTALLSFNSFADTTTDIKNIAKILIKDSMHQMNTQFTTSIKGDIDSSLNMTRMSFDIQSPVLLAKVGDKISIEQKHTAQAADE